MHLRSARASKVSTLQNSTALPCAAGVMNWFAQFGRWLVDDISRRLDEMSGRRKAALAFSVLLLIFLLWWRGPRPGDLYSVEGEGKNYKVAKVLVVDSDAVHIRLYKNSFAERPSNVDPS